MSINSIDGYKQDSKIFRLIGIAESNFLTMKRQFKRGKTQIVCVIVGTVIRYDEYCLVLNLVLQGQYFSRTITLMSSGFNSQNSDNSAVI